MLYGSESRRRHFSKCSPPHKLRLATVALLTVRIESAAIRCGGPRTRFKHRVATRVVACDAADVLVAAQESITNSALATLQSGNYSSTGAATALLGSVLAVSTQFSALDCAAIDCGEGRCAIVGGIPHCDCTGLMGARGPSCELGKSCTHTMTAVAHVPWCGNA